MILLGGKDHGRNLFNNDFSLQKICVTCLEKGVGESIKPR